MPIDVQESKNSLNLIEKVEKSKNLIDELQSKAEYIEYEFSDIDLNDHIQNLKNTIDELIKRNIQAYQLIINFSRYENQVLIANAELSLYKRLAEKFPEYQKYFIK